MCVSHPGFDGDFDGWFLPAERGVFGYGESEELSAARQALAHDRQAQFRAPDLVQRDFSASRPGELWFADFTHLRY
jgi:hypothetical protein